MPKSTTIKTAAVNQTWFSWIKDTTWSYWDYINNLGVREETGYANTPWGKPEIQNDNAPLFPNYNFNHLKGVGGAVVSTLIVSSVINRLVPSNAIFTTAIVGTNLLSNFIEPVSAQQNNLFFNVMGGVGSDSARDITKTVDGDFVITGTTIFGTGAEDVLLAKLSVEGNVLWAQTLGGGVNEEGQAIEATSDGGFAVTGWTVDSYGLGNFDSFLAKFYGNGTLAWQKNFGGSGDDRAYDLQAVSDGGLVIAGSTTSFGVGGTGYDTFLAKFANNGTFLWMNTLGGILGDESYALTESSDFGLVLTGGTVSFGVNGFDTLLAKFSSNGTLAWARRFGRSTDDDGGFGLTKTNDNAIIVVGRIIFNSLDIFLAKFSNDGTFQWAKAIGGNEVDVPANLIETSDSGLVIVGYTQSFNVSGYDFFISKLLSNGNFLWAKTLGGNNDDLAFSAYEILDGSLIVTGSTNSFGAGNYDVLITKLDQYGNLPCNSSITVIPAVTDISSLLNITVINPTVSFWNPIVTDWNAIVKDFVPSLQYPCLTSSSSSLTIVGGVGTDVVYALTNTTDGGYVAAGYTNSFHSGSNEILVTKFSKEGAFLWASTLGGVDDTEAYAVLEITNGEIIVASSSVSFGPGSWYDVVLSKYSSDGTMQWVKTFSGIVDDYARVLEKTNDGGWISSGGTYSFGAGNADIFISKFLSNGSFLWANTLGGISADFLGSLQEASNGDLVITATTYSFSVDVGVDADVLLTRLTQNGTFIWAKTLGRSNGLDEAVALQQTIDGGFIIGGDTTSFSAGFVGLLAKFSSNGTLSWAKISPSAVFKSIQETADGEIVVAGLAAFHPVFAKFSINGTLIWSKVLTSLNGVFYAIESTSDNEFVLTGYTNS